MRRTNMDKEDKMPKIEDYGSPGTDSVRTSMGGSGESGDPDNETANQGLYGDDSTRSTQDKNGGERFGEFEDTGIGTDLTVEMENTDIRSGQIKGGQHGASDAAGLAQYGGEAGSVRDEPRH